MWDYICYPIADLVRTKGLQEAEAARMSRQLIDEVGKVVSPTQTSVLLPGQYFSFYFCWLLGRSQVHSAPGRSIQRKIPLGSSVIELANFRFERQCLKQMRHLVPPFNINICGPLHDNKQLNVNLTLFRTIKRWNVNWWQEIYLLTVCEIQSCVLKLCWIGTFENVSKRLGV